MLSPEFHQTMASKIKILNLIWGAMTFACVVYVAVAWFILEQSGSSAAMAGEATGPDPMLGIVFKVVAFSMLVASIVAERLLLAPSKLASHLKNVPSAAAVFATNQANSSAPSPEQIRLFENLSETEQRVAGLGGVYQTSRIIIWALREGVVVLGLVLAIMQGSFPAIIPFAAVGLLAMIIKVPRPVSFYESQLDAARRFV